MHPDGCRAVFFLYRRRPGLVQRIAHSLVSRTLRIAESALRGARGTQSQKLRPATESCTLHSMEWTDEGIVLGVRRHGESSAIVEVMTRGHGRHLGLVRGGAGSRMRPVLQPGNTVRVTWRARLDEHLGHFTVEALRLRTADLMVSAHAVYGVTHLAALCRLLPERDPHGEVHDALAAILDH